jgi:hypothetical protein
MKSVITSENIHSLDISRDLKKEAIWYSEFTSASVDNLEVRRLLLDVKLLAANALYPALLSSRSSYNEGEMGTLLNALLVYFVRHTVVGKLENSLLETTVFSTAKEIRSGQSLDDAVRLIKSKLPSDDEFQRKFETTIQARSNSARYLLRKLVEYRIKTEELTVELPDKVHVEHIYPQEPQAENRWAQHDSVLNRLGNLTLLTKNLNIAAQNSSFEDKKKFYEESVIPITGLLKNAD